MSRTPGSEREAAAVIPARYGASRFPGKVLADLGGKPVLQHVYENCSGSGLFRRVLVATDSREVFDAARGFGAEAVMTGPGHGTGTERVAEAAAGLEEEIILNVQGDEPFADTAVLTPLVKAMARSDVQVATLVSRIEDPDQLTDPGLVKVVFDERGFALYFSRWPIPFCREAWLGEDPLGEAGRTGPVPPGAWWKHLGIYAFRKEALLEMVSLPPSPAEISESLEQLRLLHHGIPVRCVPVEGDFIGIDTPEDLDRARAFLGRRG
jgi:3-deoxy-manno-octulosonate cytidylyltransferase (CMP-KDO synthetase)